MEENVFRRAESMNGLLTKTYFAGFSLSRFTNDKTQHSFQHVTTGQEKGFAALDVSSANHFITPNKMIE